MIYLSDARRGQRVRGRAGEKVLENLTESEGRREKLAGFDASKGRERGPDSRGTN